MIPVHIRPNIKLAEAPSHGQTIFEYEPQCNGAADYEAVAAFLSQTNTSDESSSSISPDQADTKSVTNQMTDTAEGNESFTQNSPFLAEEMTEGKSAGI